MNEEHLREQMCEAIADSLSRGGPLVIENVGTFMIQEFSAYDGLDPQSGQPVSAGTKKLLFFKVHHAFKEFVHMGGPTPPQARCAALIERVTSQTGLSFEVVERALETWWRDIAEQSARVDTRRRFELGRLGVLNVQCKPPQNTRLPDGTLKELVPSRRVVTFRPTDELTERLNST